MTKTATKCKPQLWKRVVSEVKSGGKGGRPVSGALERLSWRLRDTRQEEARTAVRKVTITHFTNGRKRSGAPRVGRTRHKVRTQLENATYPSRSVIICRKQPSKKRRIRNVVILRKVNNIQNSLNQTISLRSRSQSPTCLQNPPTRFRQLCVSLRTLHLANNLLQHLFHHTICGGTGVLSGVFAGVTGVDMFSCNGRAII